MILSDTDIYQAELTRWRHRYEQILDQLPVLLETMRTSIVPLAAARLTERVSGGGGEAPLPFRADPMDDTDELWAVLVEYVTEVAERLHEPAPETGSWVTVRGVQGLPAWVDGNTAYRAGWGIVAWLVDRAERIRSLDLDDSERFLFTLVRKLLKRYVDSPPIERPAHKRVCVVCGEREVRVMWVLDDGGTAECRCCGATYEREEQGRG